MRTFEEKSDSRESVKQRTTNRVLRGVSGALSDELWSRCEAIRFTGGETIYVANSPAAAVYFIESGLISLVKRMLDGRTVEVCMVGCEGAIPPYGILGAELSILGSIAHVPVTALRIERRILQELRQANKILAALQAYALGAVRQMVQIAACNALHTVEQRCCRWLLSAHDRVAVDEVAVTHQVLAEMLGAGRTAVSYAAGGLQERGAIRYSHGRIRIVDRACLETHACECYGELSNGFLGVSS